MVDVRKTQIHAPHDKARDERVSVEIHDAGFDWPIVLYFKSLAGGPLLGFQVGRPVEPREPKVPVRDRLPLYHPDRLADVPPPIDPVKLTRIVANLPLYVEYAQAAIEMDQERAGPALAVLRNLGRTKRGLPDAFYEEIGREYETRRAAGEVHLVKAIAEAHVVDRSTASRWVKEARRRNFIEAKES